MIEFAWDDRKAASNLRKHGVSFPEATEAVRDPGRFEIPDRDDVDRTCIIGLSRLNVLYVVLIEDDTTCRIISARRASRYEQEAYFTNRS